MKAIVNQMEFYESFVVEVFFFEKRVVFEEIHLETFCYWRLNQL